MMGVVIVLSLMVLHTYYEGNVSAGSHVSLMCVVMSGDPW